MCHHIFDWTQQGIRQHIAHALLYQKNLLHAGKARGVCLSVWLPVKLLRHRCRGLYSLKSHMPFFHPSLPPLFICSSLHLLQSAGLRLKVNTEVTVKAANNDKTNAD